tara:strand:+ start:972 stop:1175 length:204 start_codon:yes stop_codon:yes gene_type:complete
MKRADFLRSVNDAKLLLAAKLGLTIALLESVIDPQSRRMIKSFGVTELIVTFKIKVKFLEEGVKACG